MMTDRPAEPITAGVGRVYLRPERDQMFLLPVSMRDWLEPGHLAWFLIDAVERMDTRALHRRPGGCLGRPPYQPEMMCVLVLYAYCRGIRSSRQIESSCRTDAAFRVICGGLMPDHATIARFVVDHERALAGLFVDGVRLCAQAGLVDLSVLALDGTKIAADASLARNRDAEWVGRQIAMLMALTVSTEQPAVTAPDLDPVPGGAGGGEPAARCGALSGRLARLEAALAVSEAEDRSRAQAAEQRALTAAKQAEQGRKLSGRKPTRDPHAALARARIDRDLAADRLDAMRAARAARDSTARGEKPKAPPPCRIRDAQAALDRAETQLAGAREAIATATAAKANITDADSRVMKTKDGWVQGYNCQSIVTADQIVVAFDVSQDANDVLLYQPMISTLQNTLSRAGVRDAPELILADAGYCSEQNLTAPGPDRLIATTKSYKQRCHIRQHGHTDGPPPPGLTATEENEHLLRTPQGTAAYKQRSQLIEAVFGDRKHNRQIRRFRRRGLTAVHSEWALIHLAGNLQKLHRHQAATA